MSEVIITAICAGACAGVSYIVGHARGYRKGYNQRLADMWRLSRGLNVHVANHELQGFKWETEEDWAAC